MLAPAQPQLVAVACQVTQVTVAKVVDTVDFLQPLLLIKLEHY
jgi:hypothetical protein